MRTPPGFSRRKAWPWEGAAVRAGASGGRGPMCGRHIPTWPAPPPSGTYPDEAELVCVPGLLGQWVRVVQDPCGGAEATPSAWQQWHTRWTRTRPGAPGAASCEAGPQPPLRGCTAEGERPARQGSEASSAHLRLQPLPSSASDRQALESHRSTVPRATKAGDRWSRGHTEFRHHSVSAER